MVREYHPEKGQGGVTLVAKREGCPFGTAFNT